MKLYELTEEFDRIFTDTFNEDVDEDVYFLNEERKKRLDDAALAVDQKIEAIAAVIKNKKAEKDARVGMKPVTVKATKAKGSSDLVLSAADAKKLSESKEALESGGVVVVID